jgi:hypothetical protein
MKPRETSLITATALVIMGLSACSSSPTSDFTTMCEDASHIRIEDSKCDDSSSGSSLVFISTGSNYHAPPVGGRVDQSQILRSLPPGKTVQKAAIPSAGGVVKSSPGITRGGFGSKSSGGSSGG